MIPSIPRVNFPGLCLSDAGNGLRSTDYVSSWASGWSVGAAFNRDLAHQRAVGMAGEFRKKGSNIALGPVVGPLGRVAQSGRNWEGFANDPYLSGQLAYESVVGIQSAGIITSVKVSYPNHARGVRQDISVTMVTDGVQQHFIGNEQETYRNPTVNISAVSANIDDKTMHELYLW